MSSLVDRLGSDLRQIARRWTIAAPPAVVQELGAMGWRLRELNEVDAVLRSEGWAEGLDGYIEHTWRQGPSQVKSVVRGGLPSLGKHR